jgi:hypothetical protein
VPSGRKRTRTSGFARLEQANIPPVRRIQVAGQESAEARVAAGLELDEILRLGVVAETCGGACIRWCEFQLIGKRNTLRERGGARHPDVEIDKGQRRGEVAPRQCAAKRGKRGERNPENGFVS